ncbi:hypothetical protein, partial [Phenylobacterium sp. Root700]|uniref:hypothetical protein n=2 Tax=unclassified Phenylobacterium TaxID=2640670 RepID=UPI001F2B0E37
MSLLSRTGPILAGLGLLALAAPAIAQEASPPEFRSSDLPQLAVEKKQDKVFRTDVIEIPLAATKQLGSRTEYILSMKAGDALVYSLTASKPVHSEFHGASDASKAVMFYREETATSATHGQLVAPMTGAHGWYLANTNDTPITVRLQISG